MNFRLILLSTACGLLAACATSTRTTFATSSSPASIQEQLVRDGSGAWGGALLLRAGDADIGYAIRPLGQTFTVNPGSTVIWAWYYGSRKGLGGAYIQSDPVDLRATLSPAGHYELRARIAAYQEAKTRASVGTVRFSLLDLSTHKVVATSPENLLLKGPSRLAQTEFKVSSRIWDALASAPSCCAGMQAFRFQPLPAAGYVDRRIDSDSQAFAFNTGKSYFLAYELPGSDRRTRIEVDSWVHDTVFFPRLLLLDQSFTPIGFVGSSSVHFVPAGPVEAAHYEADCSLAAGNQARYLIILTTETDLGSVLESTADVSFTQGAGGGAAPAENSDHAVLGAAGASDAPTDLPPSAHDARAVTTSLAGATIAHDFAPVGRLTISVSQR